MFSMIVTGKITKIYNLTPEAEHRVFALEEEYYAQGAVRQRRYLVYVKVTTWDRRVAIIKESYHIGVEVKDLRTVASIGVESSTVDFVIEAQHLFLL